MPFLYTGRRPHWSKRCVYIKSFEILPRDICAACSDYNFLLCSVEMCQNQTTGSSSRLRRCGCEWCSSTNNAQDPPTQVKVQRIWKRCGHVCGSVLQWVVPYIHNCCIHGGEGQCPWSIFPWLKWLPTYKACFIGEMRKALSATSLQQDQYAGHSFQMGAGTAAAQIGLEDSTIKALGRWNSLAFLLYIHTLRDQLASVTQSLAKIPAIFRANMWRNFKWP